MEFYNKHYIKVDSSNRVVEGWSDGPHRDKDTTDAICINDKGGYQFRLVIGEEQTRENPDLMDWGKTMIPVPAYKYEGGEVVKRTEEEIEADREVIRQKNADREARALRDKLLAETDWTQTLDAPLSTASKEEFRVYRQALRDVPQQADYPNTIHWPVKPEAVKADPEPVDTVVDAIIGEEGLE